MEIGEKVLYLHKGTKWWEGNNKSILESDNEELNKFIFASKFLDKLRRK
jgi:phospholipid/cholesterol/gamma-HCH transport system ATP-binding protein